MNKIYFLVKIKNFALKNVEKQSFGTPYKNTFHKI